MEKTNDWLATLLYNPDKDINNFKTSGLTPKNTGLKDRSEYLNVQEIKDTFKNEDGSFNSLAFNQYYDSALRLYNDFVKDDVNDSMFKEYVYSPLNLWKDSDDKITTPTFGITKIPNPNLKTYGVYNLFGEGAPKRSMREAAQTQKVYNWESKEFEDWTPNDDDKRGVFDFWSVPTLVEAKWEEDGEHEENGRLVKHYKGQNKLNTDGMPYYETLGDRDVAGKSVLHLSDTLTVDGTKWNDYDIFDSDSIDKSVGGTTMNLIASVVPLFIPGVGLIYKWATISLGLSKALGTFGKSGLEFFGQEDSKLWEYMNNLDSFTSRFDRSTSDYGTENPFSWEGIGGIIKDSILQLYQQREVAKLPTYLGLNKNTASKELLESSNKTYLGKFGKTFEEAVKDGDVDEKFFKTFMGRSAEETGRQLAKFNKLSRSMSSTYMALTQSSDVYNTMKNAEFSPEYTAIGMIASLVGFKKIMDSELGNVALQGLGLDDTKQAVSKFLKAETKRIKDIIGETDIKTKAGKFLAIKKVADFINLGVQKIAKSPILLSSAKEGLEEVSEEVLQDGILGLLTAVDNVFFTGEGANYVPWENNMAERYGAALLGGLIGGTIFKGVELGEARIKTLKEGNITKALPKTVLQDLETVIRNGGTEEALNIVDKWMKSGKIASTELSLDVDTNLSNDEKTVFKTTQDVQNSQNNVIGEYLKNYIRSLNTIINEDGLGLTDSQVLNAAFDKDTKLVELSKNGIDQDILNDFTSLLTDIVKTKSEINTTEDNNKDKLNELNSKLTDTRNKMAEFLNGGKKADFVEEMLFQLNRSINAPYLDADIYMFAKSKGKNYLTLSDGERESLNSEYEELKKNNRAYNKFAFKVFKDIRETIQADLRTVSESELSDITSYTQLLDKKIGELNDQLGILSEEEISSIKEEYKKNFLKDIDVDTAIQKLNLNSKQHKLTETQKQDLLNKYIENSLQFKQVLEQKTKEKRLSKVTADPRMGIEEDLFYRTDQDKVNELAKFDELLTIIDEVKTKFGFIDNSTAKKLNTIVKYYNRVNVSESIKHANPIDIIVKAGDNLKLSKVYQIYTPILDNGVPLFSIDNIHDSTLSVENGKYILTYNISPDSLDEIQETLEMSSDPETNTVMFSDGTSHTIDKILQGNTFKIELTEEQVRDIFTSEVNASTNISEYSKLHDEGNTETAKLILTDDLFDQTVKVINKANSILSGETRNNPVYKLLNTITQILLGDNITEVLQSEEDRYQSLSSIDDYVIANSITEQQLRALAKAIEILQSQLLASINDSDDSLFNFNKILNAARAKLGMPELSGLSTETVISMGSKLLELATKVQFLLDLHDANNGSKIQESKKTFIRLNCLLSTLFVTDKKNVKLNYEDKDGNVVDFLDLSEVLEVDSIAKLEEIYTQGKLDDESSKFANECLYKVKKAIYQKFQGLDEDTRKELLSTVASDAFLVRDWSAQTDINKNIAPEDLSNEFICNYLVMSMVSDPEEFASKFKEVCTKNPDKYVPFAGQLVALEFNWALINHSSEINYYLQEIIKGSSNPDIKSNYNTIDNTVFCLGDPGSGKTTAVGWFTNEMIKLSNPDAKVWCAAPTESTATKLAKILGQSEPYSKAKLFDTLLTESGKAKLQYVREFFNPELDGKGERKNKLPDGFLVPGSESKLNVDFFNSDDFSSNVPDYIFIDEITHFNYFETVILGNIKSKSGKIPKIINLGDPNQSGVEDYRHNSVSGNQGITFSSPNLNMSVRADNTTKLDNLAKMSTILKQVQKEAASVSINRLKFNAAPFIELIQKNTKLKYYESGNTIHGEKMVSSLSISEVERLMSDLKEGEKIALITDKDSGALNDFFLKEEYKDKLVKVSPDNVQGAEFKYTIIDVTWIPITANTNPAIFISELQKAYTLLTRSAVGTIIIDPNKNCIFSNNERTQVSRSIEIDKTDISNYSSFLLSSFAGLNLNVSPETSITPTTQTEPEIVEVTSSEANRALETFKEEPKEESKDFLNKNLAVYSGFYFSGNSNEDINGLDNTGNSDNQNKEALVTIKSLLLNTKKRIAEILNDSNNKDLLEILSVFAIKYFPNSNSQEAFKKFKDAILNGNFAIKVKRAESGDIPYNRPETGDLKYPPEGTVITKLVYRIPLEDKNSFDISIGFIGDKDIPSNVNSLLDKLKSEVSSVGGNKYLNLNKDYSFQVRGIDIRPGLDINGRDIDPEKSTKSTNKEARRETIKLHTLEKFKVAHPELNISNPLIVTQEMSPEVTKDINFIRKGQSIVLVSRDLFLTEDQMIKKFTAFIKDGNLSNLDGITPIWITPVGMSVDKFFDAWRDIKKSDIGNIAKGNRQYLGGYMQGTRMLNVLIGLKSYLTNPDTYNPDKRKSSQRYWPNKTQLNQFFTGDPNKIPSSKDTKPYLDVINTEIFSNLRSIVNVGSNSIKYPINYSKLNPRTLGLTSEQSAILESKIKEKNNPDNGFIEALEDLKSSDSKFNDLYEVFSEAHLSGVVLSGEVMDLFRAGFLPPLAAGYTIVNTIAKARETNETCKNIIDVAMDNSQQFINGVQINPINSVETMTTNNGLVPAGLNNENYYIDQYIGNPRFYLSYSDFNLTESESTTQVGQSSASSESVTSTQKNEFLKSVKFDLSLYTGKYIEELKKFLESKLLPIIEDELKNTVNQEEAISNINEYFKNYINYGALTDAEGEFLALIPEIKLMGDGTIYVGNETRTSSTIYKDRASMLASSLFSAGEKRISKTKFMRTGQGSISEYIKFINPRYCALNIDNKVYFGELNMSKEKPNFKFYSPSSEMSKTLINTYSEEIKQLKSYKIC